MKKITALLLFFSCNALLVFLEVHKQGQYLKLVYEIQKLQTQITKLKKEHSTLTYELTALQQPVHIATCAEQKLGMKPMELKNIQKIKENVVEDTDEQIKE